MKSFFYIIFVFVFLSYFKPLNAQKKAGQGIIDDFENPNPYKNYQVKTEDLSSLILNNSSDRVKGFYSLEMAYYLKRSLPSGSSVVLERYYKEDASLNLKNLVKFSIAVKGDGSGNVFKLSFIDRSNEIWEYENKGILHSTKWETLSLSLSEFKLSKISLKNNKVFDLNGIKGYKITIYNMQSKTIQGVAAKSSQGSVLLDNFYAVMKGREAVELPEDEIVKDEVMIKESPIKFAGILYGEYFSVPDEFNELKHWGKIDINATYDNISAKIAIASESQNFGDAAYRVNENEKYTGQVHQEYPNAVIPFIQLRVNNISDYINTVTFGNLWFEYSKNTFSQVIGYDSIWGIEKVVSDWGYKGLSAEGNLKVLNYHSFIIKHSYDSYTYGFRLNKFFNRNKKINLSSLDIKFYFIGAEDTAKNTNENKIIKFADDHVYSIDIASRFFDYKVGLEGFIGYNKFKKTGQVDYVNPFEPVFQQALYRSISKEDSAYRVKAILDNLIINDVYIAYEYRHLGEDFKPKYRREPITYDDIESDQTGHNILASYWIWGFTLTGEWDDLIRISNKDFYRDRISGSISCNKIRNILITYFSEWKREKYEYTSTRSYYHTSRDDEIIAQELYLKAQLRYNFDIIFKLRIEDVKWPEHGEKFNTQSLYMKSNYYLANNFYIFGETRITRFGDVTWYSPGYNPYIDNFVRVGTRFNF